MKRFAISMPKEIDIKDKLISLVWGIIFGIVIAILYFDISREIFVKLTKDYPYLMGIIKIGLLGTMGELFGAKIGTGKWRLGGIRLWQRVIVWAFLGVVFTAVFPLFSFGVDGLLEAKLLPGKSITFLEAFWKSFFMNIIFAFPMMVFHRFTDTLIEKGKLFTVWPVTETFISIDWKNMFRIVGFACIWFWIPAHTITFLLPAEFRVMSAALLAIALGFILGLAKRLSIKKK